MAKSRSVRQIPVTKGNTTAVSANCPRCHGTPNEALRNCPTCSLDLGSPNVRVASAAVEVEALAARLKTAMKNARRANLASELTQLRESVKKSSKVVVAMPLLYARTFVDDARVLYTGYENLVGGQSRVPAPSVNDRNRASVAGKFFGSYAANIRYGVLSLDGTSLQSYGLAFMTLRDVTVADRVSFLEENTYIFANEHHLETQHQVPTGFRSVWANRADLVVSKLEPQLAKGDTVAEWASRLVQQAPNRQDERCVEAHIFDGFNVESVESVQFSPAITKRDRLDAKCIQELMANRTRGSTTK